MVSGSLNGQIQIWDVHKGQKSVGPFKDGHREWVSSVSFSPDGTQIVSGSGDGTLRIWDAQTGTCAVGPLLGHSDHVWSVAFSPNGQMVVSGSMDKTIRIWDAKTGRIITGPLSGHTRPVRSIAFSPDSKCVISTSADDTIRVWDTRAGVTVVGPLENHIDIDYVCAVFSPDGERLLSVSGDGTINSRNAKTGVLMSSLEKRVMPSTEWVSFSRDCSFVISGSSYCPTLSISEISTGECIAELKGHTKEVTSVALSANGRWVASGSFDDTVRIWDVDHCRHRYSLKESTASAEDN